MVSGLLREPPHAEVGWLVDILVQCDELGLAESLIAGHELLEVPARAEVFAARATVYLATDRFELAVDKTWRAASCCPRHGS